MVQARVCKTLDTGSIPVAASNKRPKVLVRGQVRRGTLALLDRDDHEMITNAARFVSFALPAAYARCTSLNVADAVEEVDRR